MIRVAHLLPNMRIGGRERIVADLCRTAAGHGIEPLVIAYDPHPGMDGSISLSAPMLALDRRRRDFAEALSTLLSDHHVDILHAQGHVAAALVRPVAQQVASVATLHVALGRGWRWLPAIGRGLRAMDAVTAVSDDLARRFRFLAGQPVSMIPTGVDLARFGGSPAPRSNPIFTIGMAARLHPVKRHLDAVAALRILQERGFLCRLRLAGDGAEAASIRKAAEGLDVELLGPVSDMPAFLAGLDAFLLPSDHEGSPAALLEAMASGVPCVASAVGGVSALVGDAALLVPRRKPAAIADALALLMSDVDLAERLARAGAARAARFSLEAQAEAYAALYRTILAARGTDAASARPR